MTKRILIIIAVVVVLGGLVWIARPGSPNTPIKQSNSTLTVEEANNYSFGTISMAEGSVSHEFKIKNTGSEAVVIKKLYTSCMCTTTTIGVNGKQFGPFGMVGMGYIPAINQTINPGEEATVKAIFDPAAHGPAGVGHIERVITLENNAGEPIELHFTAVVTP